MKICMMSSPFVDVVKEIEFAGKHFFQGFKLVFEHPEETPNLEVFRKDRDYLLLSKRKLEKLLR